MTYCFKKKWKQGFVFILLLLSSLHTFSQKKESAEEMIEKAKKEIENDPDMDAKDKAMMLRMMNSTAVKRSVKTTDSHPEQMETIRKMNRKLHKLPQTDARRIATIPSQPLSKEQCSNYIQNLSTKVEGQLTEEDKAAEKKIITQTGNRSSALSTVAVSCWYNGNPDLALALALKAAKPDSILALNNAGAMLNLLGYEEKAVPLLQYASKKEATNSSVLNNLGRAYIGLGEKQKGKEVLMSCVQLAPGNPEANNMLGCLYEEEGNKTAAASHFSKSLEGGYNRNAYEHLSKLDPGFDLVKLIGKHYKAPEYFNQFAITVPRECFSIDEGPEVKAEHQAFEEGLKILEGKYLEKGNESSKMLEKDIRHFQQSLLSELEEGKAVKVRGGSPLGELAGLMMLRLSTNYNEDKLPIKKEYETGLSQLRKEFKQTATKIEADIDAQKRYGPMGEYGNDYCYNCEQLAKQECRELTRLANETQRKAADLHTLFKSRYRRLALDYFDRILYWQGFTEFTRNDADGRFYNLVSDFLSEIRFISFTTPYPFYDGCQFPKPVEKSADYFAVDKTPFCPVEVSIPFLVGKLGFDCTSFSISGGEGVKLKYKKDFSSGQSTISIGAGISAEAGIASVGADESIYVTFNGDNQPSDLGLKWEASDEISVGTLKTDSHTGYTVSMNSGWDFTSGAFGQDVHL